jgi:hypothetical protein
VSFGRRLIAAAVAFVLAAVMVVPLLAEARHEAAAPVAHVVLSSADDGHAADPQDADDLVHHAQSHAQGVVPAYAQAPATIAWKAMTFSAVEEPARADGAVRGPFEPPRT